MRRAFTSNSSLFPETLILWENRIKWSKSLPALKGFLIKTPSKPVRILITSCGFLIWGFPEIGGGRKVASNDPNPYRLWKGFSTIFWWFNVFYNKKTSENYEHRIKFLTLTSTKIIWSNRPAPMSACFPSFKKVNNFAAYQHDLMAHMGRVNNRGAQKRDFF